ncbi:MAG TPA: polysaccharide deacetylase family protein [Terriglobales bacterium]|nr:polysaccharide deacetylase family protein [Terriglobales bacterium]
MLGLLATAGLASLAAAGYNTMAPRSQLFGRTFIGAGEGSRQLALTFDDGPNDPWTPRLLEVLDRHQICATFFLIGRFVAQRPEIARQIAAAGHVIGNHTHDHPNLIFVRPKEVESQIRRCADVLQQTLGAHSSLFRPPYGGRTPQALRAVRRCGLIPVLWSVSGWDWDAKSAGEVENKVMGSVEGGDVILLHDGGHRYLGVDRSFTVSAVNQLIGRCRDQGFTFVTVPEMMKEKIDD